MDSSFTPSPDAASADAASLFHQASAPFPPAHDDWLEDSHPEHGRGHHCPPEIDPLEAHDPDSVVERTRRLRHDGWTPATMRRFLQRFAECGVLREACEAAGMSARSYYNLMDRDPLFAAGVEAARLKVRDRLADETFARGLNGCIERIYKNGAIVAERHRHDNRLAMAVLARLDARVDRAEARGDPSLRLVARWDEYLDALGEGRQEDGLALLADPAPATAPAADLPPDAGQCELHELHEGGEGGMELESGADDHDVWQEDGRWWTNYPPPPGFAGEATGAWDDEDYARTLSPAEQVVIDARLAAEVAADRALEEAQREAFFGFAPADPAGPA